MISLALGVRHAPAGVFLLGTFLGFLPEGIPLALLGSGLGKTSLWLSLAQVAAADADAAGAGQRRPARVPPLAGNRTWRNRYEH